MRYLLFLLFGLLANLASAADYYWYPVERPSTGQFADPTSACKAYVATLSNFTEPSKVNFQSASSYICTATMKGGGSGFQVTYVARAGTSCPAGYIYTASTGLCTAPFADAGKVCEARSGNNTFDKVYNTKGECVLLPDADLPAQCQYMAGKGARKMRVFIAFNDDGSPSTTPVNTAVGCEANVINTAGCEMPVAKAVDGISIQHGGKNCWVDVAFTGKPFAEGNTTPFPVADPAAGRSGVCADPTTCIVPEAPVVSDSKPCNYMSNGQVVGCETTQFQGNPGQMNCGTVNNGPYTCTTRPPTSTGSSVKTDIKTTPNADGGSTVTKNDTHTEVKCSAPGSCTTTVTKTTSVTIKDGNGNTTGSTTTCTGAKCASSTNPDANGDGLGDCLKNCEEEEEGGTFEGPDIGEAKTVAETTQAFMNAVKGSPLMSAIRNISVPSGGTCHFGSVQTYIADINFEFMCDIWSEIAPMLAIAMLAAWALLAVRILMTA